MNVLSFGELLLRLAAPGYTRILQKDSFEATFCGGEANVAVSLANFGLNSYFLTKLPDNDIGRAAVNTMRYYGVDTSRIVYGSGRMGLYYLEKGASQRPSKVIYDRAYSDISLSVASDFDWNSIFENIDWFHWTGINPALSDSMAEISKEACINAKKKGIIVSCDLNYRKKLWLPQKAQSVMNNLMPFVDVCIANEEDAQQALGIKIDNNDIEKGNLNKDGYKLTAERICSKYGCRYAAFTFRESYSAFDNGWSGMIYSREEDKCYFSEKYKIHIVDRVGGGDSFTAGIIYGLSTGMSLQDTIEFAAAASCLKHSIEGDFNRVTAEEVMQLINSGGNGRVVR